MLLMRRLLLCGLVAGFVLATGGKAQQESTGQVSPPAGGNLGEPGSASLTTQFGFFDSEDDLAGNPFLDEDLTVIEPIFLWDHNVSEDWGYSVLLSYDNISSASIDRLNAFPEQTGASGDFYYGLDYASRHRQENGDWLGWSTGFSIEYDYISFRSGINYSSESPDKNVAQRFGLTGFFDIVDIIRFDGAEDEGSDTRISITGTYNRTQVLSPKWTSEMGVTLAAQTGFLETAFNAVVLEDPSLTDPNPNLVGGVPGIEVTEELPETRLRGALNYKARRYLGPGKAIELGGRFYADDWGIFSYSIEPRLFLPIVRERLALRLRYRYYTQTGADDFRTTFAGTVESDAPGFRTQDSDLGEFDSHTYGARIDWTPPGRWRWFLDVNQSEREDGLDYFYASVGTTVAF